MVAVTENKTIDAQAKRGLIGGVVNGGEKLYQGTMCFFDGGFLTGVAGGNQFAGINKNFVDNSAGSDGNEDAERFTEGVFYLSGSGFSQDDVGVKAYASDNFTVTTTSTGNSLIGKIVAYESTTKVGVKIDVQQA